MFMRRSFSSKTCDHEPLRILFCGSDAFSIASLQALHTEKTKRPDSIASIDVICRPGKRYGRGLKEIREVPIKAAARSLSLPIHEIDTFTGWTSPGSKRIDLIIAVSFGLFVPPRILKASTYGGLNVHPSLLSNFRGPAPLHHTLLAGHSRTGVTLQTLHPESFDHGIILDQSPPPGIMIPNPETCTVLELLDVVAPKGAEMLVKGVRNRIFMPPLKNAGWHTPGENQKLIHAYKIKPADRHIDWSSWTWPEINRRQRVIGPLWNVALAANKSSNGDISFKSRRVIFSKIEEVEPFRDCERFALIPGVPFIDGTLPLQPGEERGLYVFTKDSKLIRIREMKVEGEQVSDAVRAAHRAQMVANRPIHSAGHRFFCTFYNPLH
ncbi:hypothetical protein Egran_02678 [Elaphomyces granulatus]|uniref:methionyl-tRNA formyltransferase n=1 Tax=Elaphomyces granulatus TaxID=519963 RepID=A0A232LZG1_9EURO|nr:hypothetical protein Egran_02678 [Elaphomyces granulatus]